MRAESVRRTLEVRLPARIGLIATAGFMLSACGREPADAQNASLRVAAAAPSHDVQLPAGYRDWPLISVASVGEPVNDLRAKLGNPVAMQAFRSGRLPFPDGTIIARLAWKQAISEENNNAFRAAAERQMSPGAVRKLLSQSFVAGSAINVQVMVKDSKTYAATGGWGFAQFTDGTLDDEAVHKTCFACHAPARERDFVFTRYSH